MSTTIVQPPARDRQAVATFRELAVEELGEKAVQAIEAHDVTPTTVILAPSHRPAGKIHSWMGVAVAAVAVARAALAWLIANVEEGPDNPDYPEKNDTTRSSAEHSRDILFLVDAVIPPIDAVLADIARGRGLDRLTVDTLTTETLAVTAALIAQHPRDAAFATVPPGATFPHSRDVAVFIAEAALRAAWVGFNYCFDEDDTSTEANVLRGLMEAVGCAEDAMGGIGRIICGLKADAVQTLADELTGICDPDPEATATEATEAEPVAVPIPAPVDLQLEPLTLSA